MVIKQTNYTAKPKINYTNEGILINDEFEVADVLLDLPYLITNAVSTYRFPYDWGTKKLRSATVLPPLTPSYRRNLTPSPPKQPPFKVEASSPNTPLSFSPSESDSKPPPPPVLPHLPSKKRKAAPGLNLRRKELEEAIRERLLTQQQLKESIEKVKEYYNLRLAENSELKAVKHKLQLTASIPTQMEPQQQTSTTITAVNDRVHTVPSTSTEYHPRAPLILHPHPLNGANDWAPAGPTQFFINHHSQPQSGLLNDLVPAGPLQLQAPLINHNHGQHQPEVVNDLVRASPLSSTQLQLHQAPLINHHNHGQPIPGVVNDQVYAGPLNTKQLHYPRPLISNQQYRFVINQAEQYNQGCQLDLYLKPLDDDTNYRANTAEARKRRLQIHKEKKTRVLIKPPNAK